MPRQSGLLLRKGRYYLNIRVPTELRPLYGKKDIFRKSLDTSDFREAVSRIRFEAFKLEAEFEEKRRESLRAKVAAEPAECLREISDQAAHALVFRWFIEQETLSQEWWENDGVNLPPGQLAEAVENMETEAAAFSGGNAQLLPDDGSVILGTYLAREGIDCPKDSPAFRKLRPLFRKGTLESLLRTIDRASVVAC